VNLVIGEVISVFTEEGMRRGKVRVGGAIRDASLDLLADAAEGSHVFLCDGVALSEVEPILPNDHVSRNSR
jgi:hydrogenase maturation factor